MKKKKKNEKQGSIFRGGRVEGKEEGKFLRFTHAAENFLLLKFIHVIEV